MTETYDTDAWANLVLSIGAATSDAPYLAAANWLERHGETDRATLLRFGDTTVLDRVGGLWSRRQNPHPNARGLTESWVTKTLTLARDLFPEDGWEAITFDRGLAKVVACPAALWLACGDRTVRREPLYRVVLSSWPRMEVTAANGHSPDILAIADDPRRMWVEGRRLRPAGPDEDSIIPLLEWRWPGVVFEVPWYSGIIPRPRCLRVVSVRACWGSGAVGGGAR